MDNGNLKCVENLLKTTNRVLKQENTIKREATEQRILLWNEIRENYNKYLDGECGVFLTDLDNCFHGEFNASLLILAISFTDNGESFAPAQRFSDNEREAYKKIIPYNVFESRITAGIKKKLELQNDETLARRYDDYQGMKKWVETSLKDPGMDEHVRYYLNNKWSDYCRNIDIALNQKWIHKIMKYKEEQKIRDKEPEQKRDTENSLTRLQEKAKKLSRYGPLNTDPFADARDQITAGRYDDARKTLRTVEIAIDTLLECESLLAAWKAKGYTLTELEGSLPINADEVRLAFQKTEQNINRLQAITKEFEFTKSIYQNLSEQPETASILHSIEQNLRNPARIDTVEKDYQQLNNAIRQWEENRKIIEQNLRDQLEKVLREVVSPEIKLEIDRIEKSIQQRELPHSKEMLMDLAEKQLSKVTSLLSKFRLDGAVVSGTLDAIRKQINAQNYGDVIIDSEKVIAEWNSIEGSRFVKVADAKQYEMNFIGRTELMVGKVKNPIEIGSRTFIVEEITYGSKCSTEECISKIKRQLTSNEKQNLPENRHLTAKLAEKKWLGAKEKYTFRALFLSRPEKYAKFGFDTKPLAMTDINPVLDDALKEAKQIGETVFLCIASPTGFEPDLRTFTDGNAFHKRFISQNLSVCFIDLETATIFVNSHDEVATSFRPLCEMELYLAKTEKVKLILYPLVDDQLLLSGIAQYLKVQEQCQMESGINDEGIIKKVFYQYGTEKELPVKYDKGVGLYILKYS